jgi:trans-aconitate 2-methyltransferase
MSTTRYTYGDSEAASARLRLLAEVYAPATRSFVAALAPPRTHLVVDAGPGPGYTTALLNDVLQPERILAVDGSEAFLKEVGVLVPGAETLRADLAEAPPRWPAANVVFCRFVLGHLPEPEKVLRAWVASLAPGGFVLAQEQEWIVAEDPVVARYVELVEGMVGAVGARLRIGPRLERCVREWPDPAAVRCNRATSFDADPAVMAEVFRLNIHALRDQAAATDDELDGLDLGLQALARSGSRITACVREVAIAGAA